MENNIYSNVYNISTNNNKQPGPIFIWNMDEHERYTYTCDD